jgi:geranylgeranyl diphosphate synthase type I
LGGVDESKQDAYRSFGHAVGLAFQVQDDILGIWGNETITGKSAAGDLLEGKKSLPVLHGLSQGGKFAERWAQGPIHPDEVEELANLLANEGSYEFTHGMSRQMTTLALNSLREADPQGEAGEALMELANKLILREQ